ncbi:hypothetical protein ASG99_18520 [Bacillus sp. Soil768D1]|nr:hypothetical protein ASG99_18520 [Bacillus sp. Soil768D1]
MTFLLRYYHFTEEERALNMVEKTLGMLARGRIYDHIGYGFSRYSTDELFLVPHLQPSTDTEKAINLLTL